MTGKKTVELERICFNCNKFLPAEKTPTEWGVCGADPCIAPHLEALLEEEFDSCRELLEEKKFTGDRAACEQFTPLEILEEYEFN